MLLGTAAFRSCMYSFISSFAIPQIRFIKSHDAILCFGISALFVQNQTCLQRSS